MRAQEHTPILLSLVREQSLQARIEREMPDHHRLASPKNSRQLYLMTMLITKPYKVGQCSPGSYTSKKRERK